MGSSRLVNGGRMCKDSGDGAEIPWDADVAETITRDNTVIDLTGSKVAFRDIRPEEHRWAKLYYSKKQLEAYKEPVNFLKYIGDILPNADDCKMFLEALAFAAVGAPEARRLMFIYGTGNNGKTDCMHVLQGLFDDEYASPFDISLVTKKRNGKNTRDPSLYGLRGRRFVYNPEGDSYDRINVDGLKQLATGRDPIVCRTNYMKQDAHFKLEFMMVITASELPKAGNISAAFRELMSQSLILEFPSVFYRSPTQKAAAEARRDSGNPRYKDMIISPEADMPEIHAAIEKERPSIIMYLAQLYIDIRNNWQEKGMAPTVHTGENLVQDVTRYAEKTGGRKGKK